MTRNRRKHIALHSIALTLAACNGRLAVLEADAGATSQQSPDDAAVATPHDLVDASAPQPTPPANCQDGYENGDETDVDCGGPACPACSLGASCTGHPDCETGVCRAGSCQATACDDGIRNGDEADVDCGGACESQGLYCVVELGACNCASSEGLMGLACGPGLDADSRAFVTPDGARAVFALSPRAAYRWATETGTVALDNQGAYPMGLSDDGASILFDPGYGGGPSLWTVGGASRTELPLNPVYALSADGSVVLGGGGSYGQSARWTLEGGAEPIGDPSSTAFYTATFMTRDGSAFGGRRTESSGVGTELFRWDATNGARSLGSVPDWYAGYRNSGVVFSGDGSVIAGFVADSQVASGDSLNQIFRWTEATGIVVVAPLWTGGYVEADYTPWFRLWLNDDGSVLVGTFDAAPDTAGPQRSAFRWTEATGAVALASTPGQESIVRDASGDTNVVVGYTVDGERPFVWDAAAGMRDLTATLSGAGVSLEGWELSKPSALSRDGRVVVGEGLCGGVPAVYRAVLPE